MLSLMFFFAVCYGFFDAGGYHAVYFWFFCNFFRISNASLPLLWRQLYPLLITYLLGALCSINTLCLMLDRDSF